MIPQMISLTKERILAYAAEKRTLEGLNEITQDITVSLAKSFNIEPDQVCHLLAVKIVRQALKELS